jgi:hypothetical protein
MPAVLVKSRMGVAANAMSSFNIRHMFGYRDLSEAEMNLLLTKQSLNPPAAPVITPSVSSSWSSTQSVVVTGTGRRLIVNAEEDPIVSTDYVGTQTPQFGYMSTSPQRYAGSYPGPSSADNEAALSLSASFAAPLKLRAVVDKDCDPYFVPYNITKSMAVVAKSLIAIYTQECSMLDVVDISAVKAGYVVITPKTGISLAAKRSFVIESDDGCSIPFQFSGGTYAAFMKLKPGARTLVLKPISEESSPNYSMNRIMRNVGAFQPYVVNVPTSGQLSVNVPTSSVVGSAVAITASASGGLGAWSYKIEADGQSWNEATASFSPSRLGVFDVKITAKDDVGNELVEVSKVYVKSSVKLPTNIVGQTPEQFT